MIRHKGLEGFRHKTLTSFKIHSSIIVSGKDLGEDGLYLRKNMKRSEQEKKAEQKDGVFTQGGAKTQNQTLGKWRKHLSSMGSREGQTFIQ